MAKRGERTGHREVPSVRIFLSSPGDVGEERTLARQFIDSELPKSPHLREKVKLELIAWDDPAARIPMLATETPQESVNAARPRLATCDIVIVILWSRMGTPLPDNLRKPNGEPYLSGTEWEYEDAVNSPNQPRPQVLVYRRTEEPRIGLRDPHKKEKEEQFERVEAFFAQLRSLKRGVNEYETPSDFKPLLRQHLEDILYRHLQPTASPAGSDARPTSAVIPADYLEWLQGNCADVSLLGQSVEKSQALTLDHVYVPALTRPATAPVEPAKGRRQREAQPEEQKPVTLLQRLDGESLYVPAPAGAGKSTFCRWAVLQSIAGAAITHHVPAPEEFAEPVPTSLRGRLPLLVPLRDFWTGMDCGRGRRTWHRSDLERALAAWVDASPPAGLTGALLGAHLEAGTAFLLLDGLDEVPGSAPQDGATVFPRELLLSGLADALPAWQKAGNRILLTSRPYGLDEAGLHRLSLKRAPLDALPAPLQDLFVARWFHTLGKPQVIPALIETIRDRAEMAPLVENPMLLTALCVLYDSGGQLPEDHYELYRRIVNNVLFNRFPGDARQREPRKARLEAIALGMHTGEADSPRLNPAAEISHLEIEHLLRAFAAADGSYEHGRIEPVAQREELLTRSGLLLPQPNERASFYHLSFQEFLAAERILHTDDDLVPVFRERSAIAEWRPTLMFLFAGKMASKTPRWGSDLLTRIIGDQTPATVKANPAPAVFIAETLDLCLAKTYAVPDELKERFRRLALGAIEDEVELQSRQALGLCLGRLGDPRIRGLRDPEAYVEVLAGRYPYGDHNKEIVDIQAPFRIGRYPVTNGQYRDFLDDAGYGDRQWWSDGGWAWLQEEKVTEPRFWHDRGWNARNQPVVGVSFWEAEACCAWAGGRLPREEEWEAAARGPHGFQYPWGDDWEDGVCNTAEAELDTTSPVGLFPRARQAELGIEDLAGNVWDWCGSLYDPPDVDDPNASRVLRGGSWLDSQDDARSAFRYWRNPDERFHYLGFRVCVRPHHRALATESPA